VIVFKESYVGFEEWPRALQMRTLCYGLLDLMPDDGLEETLTKLSEYWEFYSNPPQATPSLPKQHEIKGKFVGIVERPPLYIDEG
jgi:hypothetical protein